MHVTWDADWGAGDAADYDAFVLRSPAGHPAQTRAWAEVARAGALVSTRCALVRAGGEVVGAALVQRPSWGGLRLPWGHLERGPLVEDPRPAADGVRARRRPVRRRA